MLHSQFVDLKNQILQVLYHVKIEITLLLLHTEKQQIINSGMDRTTLFKCQMSGKDLILSIVPETYSLVCTI